MRRKVLHLLALSVIGLGSTHLLTGSALAQVAAPEEDQYCCKDASSGAECCGSSGCEAGGGKCSAW